MCFRSILFLYKEIIDYSIATITNRDSPASLVDLLAFSNISHHKIGNTIMHDLGQYQDQSILKAVICFIILYQKFKTVWDILNLNYFCMDLSTLIVIFLSSVNDWGYLLCPCPPFRCGAQGRRWLWHNQDWGKISALLSSLDQ